MSLSNPKMLATEPSSDKQALERKALAQPPVPDLLATQGVRAGLSGFLRNYGLDALIAIVAATAIVVYLFLRYVLHTGPVHLLPLYFALAAGGVPLLFGLMRQLFRRQFGSDMLAGLSIITGVLLHEYLVACIVVLMLSGGSALEQYATQRASSALRALAKRMPTTAHLVTEHGFTTVDAQSIVPGQVLAIFPHEVSPADGEVVEGYSEMDESYLTGEPFRIAKAPGAQVLSGAVNGNTVLKVRATELPVDSRYSRILRVVEEAEQNRPAMRRVADRLGAWYTPVAVLVAIAGWLMGGSPERFLAVLVIATPCPLLIAIPVAIVGGISLAARRGIVIKHPAILETIDTCRTFFFDKTGTLTYGRPALKEISCAPGFREADVLAYAGGLEQYSRHPLAQAILDAARAKQIKLPVPSGVTERPGKGLSGTIAGHRVRITGRDGLVAQGGPALALPPISAGLECVVMVDDRFAALLRFHDEPRADSSSFIRHLQPFHHANEVILLSGDRRLEVEHLARFVGIEQIYAGKSPEEKLSLVQAASKQGRTLFVGDGINDAPAMLAATASVALGGQNSDVAAEAADAVVLDSSLRRVDELIHIARRTRAIALQSAVGGMALSVLGMAFAAAGYLSPLAGAVSQEIIDLVAVLNALRITLPQADMSDF